MPTPRYHGGAALEQIPLTVPGFKGLNKESEKSILGPEWANRLENTVIDETNRVAARKGYVSQTTTAVTGVNFTQLIEQVPNSGSNSLVALGDDNKLYESTDNGASWSDVTGTAGVTDSNAQLLSFRGKVVGLQDGDAIVVKDSGNFSDIADVNQPQGGVGAACFGRLWVAKAGGRELMYSGLLDETDWTSSDTGTFSLENVWPGTDTIQAIAPFNGALAVFGEDNIVLFTDGAGSPLGIDPTQAYVVDVISGIGCVARDTVVNVKGDLWFLSKDGLQSLGRLIQEKSNPLNNLSKPIQDFLIEAITDPAIDLSNARAVYSPEDRFYLLSLPRTTTVASTDTETGRAFCFDTRGKMEDGSARCIGTWFWLVPRAVVRRQNGDLLMAQLEVEGEIGLYSGYQDDGSSYNFVYESGWIDITGTQGYLIIPKRIEGIFLIGQDVDVNIKWAFDFSSNFRSEAVSFVGVAGFAEYGEAEWGIAEWGGGSSLREARISGGGTGEYIKLGTSCTINGGLIAIQQLNVFAKIGRLK